MGRVESDELKPKADDDAAEEAVADRHGEDLAGAPHLLALLDAVVRAQDDRADHAGREHEQPRQGERRHGTPDLSAAAGHDPNSRIEHASELAEPWDTVTGGVSEGMADLMGLMKRFIRRDLAELHEAGVCIRIIGERQLALLRAGPDPRDSPCWTSTCRR